MMKSKEAGEKHERKICFVSKIICLD